MKKKLWKILHYRIDLLKILTGVESGPPPEEDHRSFEEKLWDCMVSIFLFLVGAIIVACVVMLNVLEHFA